MGCEEVILADNDARNRAAGKKRDLVHVGLSAKQFLERKFKLFKNHYCDIWHARLTLKECLAMRERQTFGTHLRGTAARHSEWKDTVNNMRACNHCWRKLNEKTAECKNTL